MCPLCELKTVLHTYDDFDPRWIIMDCMTCILPMAVWRADHAYYRKHTMDVSEKDATDMEDALKKVGEEKFGKGKFYIDKVQREVLDHLHWHARPNRFTEDHKVKLQ